MLPTLPRVVGPENTFDVPVTVFSLRDNTGTATVTIDASDPVSVVGSKRRTIRFDGQGERDVTFTLRASRAIGTSAIDILAASPRYQSETTIHLPVRASSPPVYAARTQRAAPGDRVELVVPDGFFDGSLTSTVAVSRLGNFNIDHRLRYLIGYPYGCIEQTTSRVFPQLYLRTVAKTTLGDRPRHRWQHRCRHRAPTAVPDRHRRIQLLAGWQAD